MHVCFPKQIIRSQTAKALGFVSEQMIYIYIVPSQKIWELHFITVKQSM